LTGSLRPPERRIDNARFAVEFRRVSSANPKTFASWERLSHRALVIDRAQRRRRQDRLSIGTPDAARRSLRL